MNVSIRTSLTFALTLFSLIASPLAFALPNEFHEITPRLYRGARPTVSDLEELARGGITTIVTLKNNSTVIQAEADAAASLGLHFISIPMRADTTPRDDVVDRALKAIQAKTKGKIFLHCHYGQDRTGLISALYRTEVQGWSPDEAYDEMMENGFNMKYARPLAVYFGHRSR